MNAMTPGMWFALACLMLVAFVIGKLTTGNNKQELDKLKRDKASLVTQLGDQKDLSDRTLKEAREAMAQRDKATARMEELQGQIESTAANYSAENAKVKQHAASLEKALKAEQEKSGKSGPELEAAKKDAENAKAALNTANKELTAVRADLKKANDARVKAESDLKKSGDPKIAANAMKFDAMREVATPKQWAAIVNKVKRANYGFTIAKIK